MSQGRLVLSVVYPAYEEAEVLPIFHVELAKALEALEANYRIEIIYVDDGSRDQTLDVLRGLVAEDCRVRYLSLSRNFGHQAALTAGMEHARGDAIVTLDADLQHPPELIPVLVTRWREGHDIVLTLRADDQRLSWFKRATSTVFYRLMSRWSDVDIRAAASDFRLLSRKALDNLLALRESHRLLRGMVQWLGFRVVEVPFQPNARRAGVSKYTLAKMIRLATDGLFSFSQAPLRLAVLAGLAATGLSLLVSLGIILSQARSMSALLIWLVLTAHVLTGCILGAMGVLGEYVGRIYEECKGRPIYVLKDCSPAKLDLTVEDEPNVWSRGRAGRAGRRNRFAAA